MGRKSRDKGKGYELEIAKALKPFFPAAKRNLGQYQETDGRDFVDTQPLCIQAKRRKRITPAVIEAALMEATLACDDDYLYPVAVSRSNSDRSLVTMELEHFIQFLCDLEDGSL